MMAVTCMGESLIIPSWDVRPLSGRDRPAAGHVRRPDRPLRNGYELPRGGTAFANESAPMSTLLNDARIAMRFLLRNRLFALASAAILALGIGLSATLFAIVKGTLIEPWPYDG